MILTLQNNVIFGITIPSQLPAAGESSNLRTSLCHGEHFPINWSPIIGHDNNMLYHIFVDIFL